MTIVHTKDVELSIVQTPTADSDNDSYEEEFNKKWNITSYRSDELLSNNFTSRPPQHPDLLYPVDEPPDPKCIKLLITQENAVAEHARPWLLQSDPYTGGARWLVLLSSFFTLLAYSVTMSASLYTPHLEAEFAIDRSQSSSFTSVMYGLFCAFSIVTARLVDVFGVLPVLYTALASMTLGQLLASFMPGFWSVTAAYAVLCGLGAAGTQMIGMIMCNDWFAPLGQTGFSTGFALSAVGLGGVAWTYFFQYCLDAVGWRLCLRYSAGLSLGLSGLIIALARTRTLPSSRAQALVVAGVNANIRAQLGDDTNVSVSATDLYGPPPPLLHLSPLAKPRFLLFVAILVIAAFIFYAPYVHLVPAALDAGLADADAAFVFILSGVAILCFRPVLGVMADRMGGLYVMLLANVCQLLLCLFWMYATLKWHFYLLGLFMGFSVSAYVIGASTGFTSPAALVEPHEISSAFGYVFGVAFTPGATSVGTLFGAVYDSQGSYDAILVAFAVVQAVAVVLNVVILLPGWTPLATPHAAEGDAKEAVAAASSTHAASAAHAAGGPTETPVSVCQAGRVPASVSAPNSIASAAAPRGATTEVWVYPHALYRFLRPYADAAVARHKRTHAQETEVHDTATSMHYDTAHTPTSASASTSASPTGGANEQLLCLTRTSSGTHPRHAYPGHADPGHAGWDTESEPALVLPGLPLASGTSIPCA